MKDLSLADYYRLQKLDEEIEKEIEKVLAPSMYKKLKKKRDAILKANGLEDMI